MNLRSIGNGGEDAACAYLVKKGWKIAARNVRRGHGEIDIIARKGRVTAFVEVKRRGGSGYGMPAEAVNLQKRRRIVHAAALWAQEKNLQNAELRFDVIEILHDELRHIENAFDATGLL